MKSHTFTAKDFSNFKMVIEYWMEQFGMTDWNVTVEHAQIGTGINAQTQYNYVSKAVSFRLTKVSEGDYGMVTDPCKLALHEVLHLLLGDYNATTAKLGDAYHDLVIGREHEVINKLMRVLK